MEKILLYLNEILWEKILLASFTGIFGAIFASLLTAIYIKHRERKKLFAEKMEVLYSKFSQFSGETKTFYTTILKLYDDPQTRNMTLGVIIKRLEVHIPNGEIHKLVNLYFKPLKKHIKKLETQIINTNCEVIKLADHVDKKEFKDINKRINSIFKLLDFILTKIEKNHRSQLIT